MKPGQTGNDVLH